MVENILWDNWFTMLRYCNYGSNELKACFDTETPKAMAQLDTFMQKRKFVAGDHISYVDFLLYEMLVHFNTFEAKYLEKYPTLIQFKKKFEEIPEIKKYIESNKYVEGPCINPRAKVPF